jgi:beta-1,2-mannobiose phosphorylase / 1,2-beta-oligomannan phosphorylase
MVTVKREGIVLEPTKLPFEVKAVLNPACIRKGKYVYMFYRAVDEHGHSSIGRCKLDGPLKVIQRDKKPFFYREKSSEFGIEDPRITYLNGTYYLVYIIYDGKNVRIAYATSKDLKKFTKKGIISPEITYDEAENIFRVCKSQLKERYFLFESYFKDINGKDVILWDKDAFLFPKKFKGKFALVHRILPDMQIIYFKNFKELKSLDFWKNYFKSLSSHIILESMYWYESRNIGGGCPPIETDYGWLLIYHAVDDMDKGRTYRASVALLDKKDPRKVIGRLSEPLFSPTKKWEKKGDVNNVVFPTGAVVFDGRLYIYYGAADTRIAAVSVDLEELLKELVNPTKCVVPKKRKKLNKKQDKNIKNKISHNS